MFRVTARLSKTDLALNALFCSKISVISRLLKSKLCPPQLLSRVPISWISCSLVDPYLYESTSDLHLTFSSCRGYFYFGINSLIVLLLLYVFLFYCALVSRPLGAMGWSVVMTYSGYIVLLFCFMES